jgi:phage gpG-like protein
VSAGVTGDFQKLRALVGRVEELAKASTRKSLLRQLSADALSLVKQGFRVGIDPYGDDWADPKRRGKALLDTGRLRNSFSARVVSDQGFEVGSNVSYAKFHQYGTAGRSKNSTVTRVRTRTGRLLSSKQAARRMAKAMVNAEIASKTISKHDISEVAREAGISEKDAHKILKRVQAGARRSSFVNFTRMKFKAGSGKIPVRMMLPTNGPSSDWHRSFENTAQRFFSRLMKR